MIGRTLNHYRIDAELGAGGMGEVYRARDLKLGRDVALKVMRSSGSLDTEERRRFEREAQSVAALHHPHIVTLFSLEEVEGVIFLTMELVDGITLGDRHVDTRPDSAELCGLLIPLVDALAAAHDAGIVHRDIKPSNIMVTRQGTVKLLDFGVAKLAHPGANPLITAVTQSGTVSGTPTYMSPEQLRGEPADPRSDLFSLGLVIHELVTGRHAFSGENPAETIAGILRDDPPSCAELAGTDLDALTGVLARCLAKDPSARYQTAGELRSDLVALKAGHGAAVQPGSGSLEVARTAFAEDRVKDSVEAFRALDAALVLGPEDLYRFSIVLLAMGFIDESGAAGERAYHGFLDRGESIRAGRVAVALAEQHLKRQAKTLGSMWQKRAESHLEGTDSAELGYLLRVRWMYADNLDPEGRRRLSEEVMETGRRHGDPDLESLGKMDLGRQLVEAGQVEEGMALIDEAMSAATGGRLSSEATSRLYCNMMDTCEKLKDYQRAMEWGEIAERWCPSSDSDFEGICQVHKAEVLRVKGNLPEAEERAHRASEASLPHVVAGAFYEIGEVRLRLGDLDGAETFFAKAHELGHDPQPGLAHLRLIQGQTESASTLIERALNETLPPLERANLLPARIEIGLARREQDSVKESIEELEAIAKTYGSDVHRAQAADARGLFQLAKDRPQEAVSELRQAWVLWNDLGLPYEGACSRVGLGRAFRATGNEDDARMELGAARSTFERLGAILDVKRTDALMAPPASAS